MNFRENYTPDREPVPHSKVMDWVAAILVGGSIGALLAFGVMGISFGSWLAEFTVTHICK